MKIYIKTFGCQMNRLDSELVAGALGRAGHELVDDHKLADVVLYNTCSVRERAEEKVYSHIGNDRYLKAGGRKLIVGVLGCMAQREGEQLLKQHPQVDIVCSPGRLDELADLITQAAAGRSQVALDPLRTEGRAASDEKAIDALDLARDPAEGANSFQAYVRVGRGCDKFCSYCIVPFVRGPERSRQPGHIVEEVKKLVDVGRTEITLIGQTVNSYRWSDNGQSVRFSDLLERVSAVGGLRRLRFVTSYPVDFGNDVLEAMRDLANVCEYIHCPAQSGSDDILKRMNRKYTRGEYDDFVDRARQIVPGVSLVSDFIVGFPGESEADHQSSADLIRRSGFKNSFIFKYSPRPGTVAAKRLDDDVPEDVKKRRNNELLAVQTEVGLTHHQVLIGQAPEVLVWGPSPRTNKQASAPTAESMQLVGRTRGDHIVVFDGPKSLTGSYKKIRITDATALTLFGQIESE